MRRLILGLFAAILLVVSASVSALAAPAPSPRSHNGCPPDYHYEYVHVATSFVADPGTGYTILLDPGVQGTITLTKGTQWSGSVTGQVEGDVSAIIASAKASISVQLTYTISSGVSDAGSWTNNESGVRWFAVGTGGKSFTWQYGHDTALCAWYVNRSGPGNLPFTPANAPYFKHD
jgi:hypothetical protein